MLRRQRRGRLLALAGLHRLLGFVVAALGLRFVLAILLALDLALLVGRGLAAASVVGFGLGHLRLSTVWSADAASGVPEPQRLTSG
jgi:hypothetical protein